jgi:hypothetical protein
MAECNDIKEEKTVLGTQLGVCVQLSPTFHAELAGEGVECSWAHAKSFYRRVPESQKQDRENFKLVSECTCPVNVLSKVRILRHGQEHTFVLITILIRSNRLRNWNPVLLLLRPTAVVILQINVQNRNFCTVRLRNSWKPSKGIGVPLTSTAAQSIYSEKKQTSLMPQMKRCDFCGDNCGGRLISERSQRIVLK